MKRMKMQSSCFQVVDFPATLVKSYHLAVSNLYEFKTNYFTESQNWQYSDSKGVISETDLGNGDMFANWLTSAAINICVEN